MKNWIVSLLASFLAGSITSAAQNLPPTTFQPVPELPYRLQPDFFELPNGANFGEASAVAVNSRGHIFLFQRVKPMLSEYDPKGKFLRSLGEGLFTVPHGLRIDAEDNLWTTDVGSHVVLKLSPEGRVLMVLGRKDNGAEADWLFNRPADIAFDRDSNIYVADGYGNSRIVKFDKTGRYLKSWGTFGDAPGQFELPHAIVIDKEDHVYVADRENQRIQIFDIDGKFLKQWTGIGYPYGLAITSDQHILMADGGFDRIIKLDSDGKIIGALGEPGHAPGQFAWAHTLTVGADGKLYVADTLNWRFQVFAPTHSTGKMASYIPTVRMFNSSVPSTGWVPRQAK
jgi:DNA-binding beta-propeller fold protein YncE